jgi:hypothetical protein
MLVELPTLSQMLKAMLAKMLCNPIPKPPITPVWRISSIVLAT